MCEPSGTPTASVSTLGSAVQRCAAQSLLGVQDLRLLDLSCHSVPVDNFSSAGQAAFKHTKRYKYYCAFAWSEQAPLGHDTHLYTCLSCLPNLSAALVTDVISYPVQVHSYLLADINEVTGYEQTGKPAQL